MSFMLFGVGGLGTWFRLHGLAFEVLGSGCWIRVKAVSLRVLGFGFSSLWVVVWFRDTCF